MLLLLRLQLSVGGYINALLQLKISTSVARTTTDKATATPLPPLWHLWRVAFAGPLASSCLWICLDRASLLEADMDTFLPQLHPWYINSLQ